MKPLRLEFQALGAFPGKVEIDFKALGQRGLFVVSGDTGTGKTTIFDAMCFALYGEMPSKEKGEIRSHHVGPDVETYVKFEFEAGGKQYVVDRRPEQDKQKKNGTVGKASQTALLERIDESGSTESIESQWSQVAKACAEKVGLDAQQFKRVVLLPQGEFARFLLADSKERESLLKQLFGGKIFERLLDSLKGVASEARRGRNDAQIRVSERSRFVLGQIRVAHEKLDLAFPEEWNEELGDEGLDVQKVNATIAVLREHVESAEEKVAAAKKEKDNAQTEKAQADTSSKIFEDYQSALAEKTALDKTRQEIEGMRAAVAASIRARPVVQAAQSLKKCQSSYEEALKKHDTRFATLEQHLELSDRSQSAVDDAISSLRDRIQKERGLLDDVKRAGGARDSARENLEKAEARGAELESDRASLVERIEELSSKPHDISTLRGARDEAKRSMDVLGDRVEARRNLEKLAPKLEDARSQAEWAKRKYQLAWKAFVGTQAPRLAEGLELGAACPVCGSEEHPAPASATNGTPVDNAAVVEAQRSSDNAKQRLQEIQVEEASLIQRLAGAESSTLKELEVQYEQATTAYDTNKDTINEAARTAESLESERGKAEDLGRKLEGQNMTVGHRRDALVSAKQVCQSASEAAKGIDSVEVEKLESRLESAKPLRANLERIIADVNVTCGNQQTAESQFTKALTGSAFDSDDTARSVALTEQEESEFNNKVALFDQGLTKCEGQIEKLKEQGVPAERPDTEAAETRLERAEAEWQVLVTRRNLGNDAVRGVEGLVSELEEAIKDRHEKRELCEEMEKVDAVCRKGGDLRMPLPRWALAHELDRVTSAGNVHLGRMTDSRYALRRGEEARGGLEFEVLDAHTGRTRSTRSLSGGEQFQASLALALGLADVVSQGGTGGGQRFEALFVDEGFGSLDPRALDEAVNALHQIHATGRMVGAITHVEAMKQQLHVGIEVRRADTGSGSVAHIYP
jgi:DNA repair protein SbcC/Rad50